eukprot:m.10194 g.10194  ORF g.10194 m.10194 type:complete len:320 (+) comp3628_c0_seq1:225-1184(+)
MNFDRDSFTKKLHSLSVRQESIQSLSLWLFHYKNFASRIVETWLSELLKAQPKDKLKFIYLANDVVMQGKKKGTEYVTAFKPILAKAFHDVHKNVDDKTKSSLLRVLSIWQERHVYPSEYISSIKVSVASGDGEFSDLIHKDFGPPIHRESLFASTLHQEEEMKRLLDEVKRIDTLPPSIFNLASAEALTASTDVSAGLRIRDDTLQDIRQVVGELTAFVTSAEALKKELGRCVMQEKQGVAITQAKIQETKEKVERLRLVRTELQQHVSSLPEDDELNEDLSEQLPDADELFGTSSTATGAIRGNEPSPKVFKRASSS